MAGNIFIRQTNVHYYIVPIAMFERATTGIEYINLAK